MMNSTQPQTHYQAASEWAAIEGLYHAGAHLVLTDGKKPCWKGYMTRPATPPVILRHLDQGPGNRVAVRPWSLESTVFDVDQGNPYDLVQVLGEPRCRLDSKRRPDAHVYHDDTQPRRNGSFSLAGCQGDIRGDRGIVVIYPGQAGRLLDALSRAGEYPIQTSLLDDIPPPRIRRPDTAQRVTLPADVSEKDLRTCPEGQRHKMLFHVGRRTIYPLNIPDSLDEWIRQCQTIIGGLNRLVPVPLDRWETDKIGFSIAGWTFDRFEHLEGGGYDHSPIAQFRRGLVRQYGEATAARQAQVRERNGKICDLYSIGWTMTRIGETVGLGRKTVSGILAKSTLYGKGPAERQTITEAAPWDQAGISRRTWYRGGECRGERNAEILALVDQGWSYRAIGRRLGCHHSTVSQVAKNGTKRSSL